jgi:hypothetical protein
MCAVCPSSRDMTHIRGTCQNFVGTGLMIVFFGAD